MNRRKVVSFNGKGVSWNWWQNFEYASWPWIYVLLVEGAMDWSCKKLRSAFKVARRGEVLVLASLLLEGPGSEISPSENETENRRWCYSTLECVTLTVNSKRAVIKNNLRNRDMMCWQVDLLVDQMFTTDKLSQWNKRRLRVKRGAHSKQAK